MKVLSIFLKKKNVNILFNLTCTGAVRHFSISPAAHLLLGYSKAIKLNDMGSESLKWKEDISISSMCSGCCTLWYRRIKEALNKAHKYNHSRTSY